MEYKYVYDKEKISNDMKYLQEIITKISNKIYNLAINIYYNYLGTEAMHYLAKCVKLLSHNL